ncbi:MAG: protein kinase [Kofleriaceae bacterium]|nr:protein kinase [Kofleriaceae bacterium]
MSNGERDFGPFRLVRRVAVGGMAEVHLARTKGVTGYDKYVAIKMIHPNFAEDEQFILMLVDEAKIAVQLNHANIAHTFDLGRVGDTYYITMEYVNGADLYKILRTASEKDVYLPFDCAAAIAQGMASGLDYAHRKRDAAGAPLGIVHRDVSPQNVLVSYSGEVKIVDFGIAKAALKEQQTAAGVIKGKYYYMSPEQAWGDVVDLRSDIFSAGIVLYEMITGQMLYLEENLHKLLEMVRKADIQPPTTIRRDCPPELARIAMQALRKNPHERYQRAADMAVDLERFLHSYAPTFNSNKLVQLLRQTVGEPIEVSATDQSEERSGPTSTQPLAANDLLRERVDLHDENSVLFRISDLKPSRIDPPVAAAPVARQAVASGQVVAASVPPIKAAIPKIGGLGIPSVRRSGSPQTPPVVAAAIPSAPRNVVGPTPSARPVPSRSRDPNDETREIESRDEALPRAVAPRAGGPAPSVARPAAVPAAAAVAAPKAAAKQPWIAASTIANTPPPQMRAQPVIEDIDDEVEDRGERTMISAPGFSVPDLAGEEVNEDDVPTADRHMDETKDFDAERGELATSAVDISGHRYVEDFAPNDEQPTVASDMLEFAASKPVKPGPPPAALAASNPTPSISELRKPRPSRRTPAQGMVSGPGAVETPSVLQAIVHSNNKTPMPSIRPAAVATPAPRSAPGESVPLPLMPNSIVTPYGQTEPPPMSSAAFGSVPYQAGQPPGGHNPYQSGQQPAVHNPYPYQPGQAPAYGQPLDPMGGRGYPNPTGPQPVVNNSYGHQGGQLAGPAPGQPPGQPPIGNQGYPYQSGQQPVVSNPYGSQGGPAPGQAPMGNRGYPYQSGQQPVVANPYPYQAGQVPNQMYGQPYPQQGAASSGVGFVPQAGSLAYSTNENDELPAHYRIESNKPRMILLVLAGIAAISLAAVATFLIVKSTRKAATVQGAVRVDSVPAGAAVTVDGQKLSNITPLTINNLSVGSSHELVLELVRHKPYKTKIEVPKAGGVIPVTAIMTPITGVLRVTTLPAGAELYINGQYRNRTPCTLAEVDMEGVKQIELRLKDYAPQKVSLNWTEKGELDVEVKMTK